MRVLVAYGSKMGGTKGLAEMLSDELGVLGHEPEVRAASVVTDLGPYEAVIVGGALYNLRWHQDARQFVKRHRDGLQRLPVWFFSSGPLDHSAVAGDIPPVRFVRKAMDQIGAHGHITFGGVMSEGGPQPAGDWRDRDQVRDWAKRISDDLVEP